MKKLVELLIFLSVYLLASATVFAAEITQENIKDGLNFCKEYPVRLMYEGDEIFFSEKETPPVIITPTGEENGRTLIPARALFEKMGATVTWEQETEEVTISLDDTLIKLTIGKDVAYVNGETYVLEVPALIIDHDGDYFGSTMIPVRFTAESLNFNVTWVDEERIVVIARPIDSSNDNSNSDNQNSDEDNFSQEPNRGSDSKDIHNEVKQGPEDPLNGLFPQYEKAALPMPTAEAVKKLIVIDAGHGGKDCGAIGHEGTARELYEKDLNLAIALKLRDYLKGAGMNIFMTRETDVYYTKYERPAMANEINADFFVSIHNNSSESSKIKGTEVLYYAKICNGGQGETATYGISSSFVASKIESEMVKALGTEKRGTFNRPSLAVLNKTDMPAIIVEGAYLSNEEDFGKMETDEYIDRYAYATAKAIIEAFNEKYN